MSNRRFALILITVVIPLFSSLYAIYIQISTSRIESTFSISSPIPQVLSAAAQNREISFWKPSQAILETSLPKPEISAVSAGTYDLTTNQFIYTKNIKKRLPFASLTKIMTALIALENEDPKKEITISKHAAEIGEDSMGVTEGEKFTFEELLYGLMLRSGNDAAEAIADSSKFGRDTFVHIMNKKAEDIGLTDTYFTNPTGLPDDGDQYSTVVDLLTLTKYALEKPLFAQVSSMINYDLPATNTHKAFYLTNETNLMSTYPGVKGIKTGYTEEAGLCLITYLEYRGHKIIGIILNSVNRRDEMKELLDFSLKAQGIKPPPHG